jgi:hypothetical protein
LFTKQLERGIDAAQERKQRLIEHRGGRRRLDPPTPAHE